MYKRIPKKLVGRPIHKSGKYWYFYDETWHEYGPYDTRKECREQLDEYCEKCL